MASKMKTNTKYAIRELFLEITVEYLDSRVSVSDSQKSTSDKPDKLALFIVWESSWAVSTLVCQTELTKITRSLLLCAGGAWFVRARIFTAPPARIIDETSVLLDYVFFNTNNIINKASKHSLKKSIKTQKGAHPLPASVFPLHARSSLPCKYFACFAIKGCKRDGVMKMFCLHVCTVNFSSVAL